MLSSFKRQLKSNARQNSWDKQFNYLRPSSVFCMCVLYLFNVHIFIRTYLLLCMWLFIYLAPKSDKRGTIEVFGDWINSELTYYIAPLFILHQHLSPVSVGLWSPREIHHLSAFVCNCSTEGQSDERGRSILTLLIFFICEIVSAVAYFCYFARCTLNFITDNCQKIAIHPIF